MTFKSVGYILVHCSASSLEIRQINLDLTECQYFFNGTALTWRAAALDFWKDPAGGNADQYWIQGYHYVMANNGSRIFDNYTQSGDCGGYNGWWDKEKARGE